MLNAAYDEQQFWDGQAETREDHAKQPLVTPAATACRFTPHITIDPVA